MQHLAMHILPFIFNINSLDKDFLNISANYIGSI